MPHSTKRAYQLVCHAWEKKRLAHCWLLTGAEQNTKQLAEKIAALVLKGKDCAENSTFDTLPKQWLKCIQPEKKSRRISVDSLRELSRFFHLSAPPNQWKIALIVAADRMMPEAANAFLKTMEEPPQNCLILLTSEYPKRLLTTVRSRCISLALEQTPQPLAAEETAVLELLASFSFGREPEYASIAQLRSAFTCILDEKKQSLQKQGDALFSEEKRELKDRTESKWTTAREEALSAQVQAEYLLWRGKLVSLIAQWFGDALRQLEGAHSTLYFPQYKSQIQLWAEYLQRDEIITRLEAVSHLEKLLETNVNEALLWEVSFLEIFGHSR